MLNGHRVVDHFQNYFSVDGGASVDHDLELEPRWISFNHIEIFKESEDKRGHEVHSQDSVELLFGLGVCFVNED